MQENRATDVSTSPLPARGVTVALLLAMATAACGETSTGAARSPADKAAFMERTRCGADDDDRSLAPVLSGSAVQGVRPLYSNVESAKGGAQAELRGATVTISALQGMSPEWLDRALECHSARQTLGRAPASPDDPFFLPGSSVDIDVRSARDGFDVAIAAFSSDDARQILARATAFAKSKTAASPDAGPASR